MAYKANFGPCELCLPIITKHNDHDNSPIVMQWKPKGQLIDWLETITPNHGSSLAMMKNEQSEKKA